MNKNVRDLFVIISEWHWKNTINDHLEHHVLHRGSGYFFFHLSVGNTVSLKLMGFFSEKISFFQGNKKKKGTKGVDLGSQVIPRQNYFMCQIDYNTLFQVVKQKCVRSHKNYSTISSTHHSLHYSLSLDSLFCDALLSCNSETVVQRSYKLMLDYKAQRRRRAEVSRNSIWAAQTSQVHSLHTGQYDLNQAKTLWF